RLLKELRQRTDDLSEALEQQTATSKVLRVISSSPGELEPVFQAMLENAVRICEANFGNLFVYEGDTFRIVALQSAPPAWAERWAREPVLSIPDNSKIPLARLASGPSLTFRFFYGFLGGLRHASRGKARKSQDQTDRRRPRWVGGVCR